MHLFVLRRPCRNHPVSNCKRFSKAVVTNLVLLVRSGAADGGLQHQRQNNKSRSAKSMFDQIIHCTNLYNKTILLGWIIRVQATPEPHPPGSVHCETQPCGISLPRSSPVGDQASTAPEQQQQVGGSGGQNQGQ